MLKMARPKVYLETTIPSYATALPSRDLVRAGLQQVTRDWWATRHAFDLYVSQLALDESICRTAGFEPPVICTPVELVEEDAP